MRFGTMIRLGALIACLGFLSAPAQAHDVTAMGATTCGQSTCHAADKPWPNSAVTQKEYLVWRDRDPHARSFRTLQTAKANRIAQDLGYERATAAKLCLDCHSFNISHKHREPTFNQAEGVTCEACHGPASEWLGVHTSGLYFYQRNLDEGMYPTTDPTARAELCLSCHMGTASKFVNHRMFVAGHPRLPFELGFYTWFSEPTPGRLTGYSHFEVDDDYLQRKPWPFGVRVWSIGQAVQMKKFVELMTHPEVGQEGLFPEFAFFECHSCHGQPLTGGNATSNTGVPRINDSHAFFVELAARLVDRNLAARINGDIVALRAAAGGTWAGMQAAAQQLERDLNQLIAKLERRKFSDRDTRWALAQISAAAQQGVFDGYYDNEQAVLAAGSLVDELEKLEVLGGSRARAAKAAVSRGIAAFTSQDNFNASQVRAALAEAARLTR